jgi:hypothetical protein
MKEDLNQQNFKAQLQKVTLRPTELRNLYLRAIEESYGIEAKHFNQKIENFIIAGAVGEQ